MGRRSAVAAALVLGTVWYVGCDGAVEPDPNPPVAVEPIADQAVTSGDSVVLDLWEHFIDPDGDTLQYTARTSDALVAAAAVTGGRLTVRALSPGQATVTVTATDPGGLSAEEAFVAVVPNRPPEAVGAIAGLEMFTGESAGVDVADYFADPDGGALAYTAATRDPNSADTSNVAVSVSGATATVAAVFPGEATVTVTATDAGGLEAEQAFAVTVPNRPPVAAGTIADVEVFKYDEAGVYLAGYFTDPDGEVLRYTAETTNGVVAAVSVSGDTLAILGAAQGRASITVTASDAGGLTAEQTVLVTVPNRAPGAVDTIPGVEVFKYGAEAVAVSAYFADPDGEPLSYAAETSNEGVAAISVVGDSVTVLGVVQGRAVVTVTASDSAGATAEQVFAVAVPNRPPGAVGSIPGVEVFKYDAGRVDVSGYFADADRDALAYAAATSNGVVAAVSVAGDMVTVSGVAQGEAEVTVTARDSAGATAEQVFAVTVPNRPPGAVGSIPAVAVFKYDTGRVDVRAYFADPDRDELGYVAETSNGGVAAVVVSGVGVMVAGVVQGRARVTVTARDSAGATAVQAFVVTVPNRAPEAVGAVAGLELFKGDSGRAEVSGHFSDPDGDVLSYAAETSDPDVAAVAVAGGTVSVSARSQGQAVVTVVASDSAGATAVQAFVVTVPNRAPEAVGAVVGLELFKGDSGRTEVSGHFSDPDEDPLGYAVETADADVAVATVAGGTVTVRATGQGETTVTVTASDPGGLAAEQAFTATVPNRAPEAVGELPGQELFKGDSQGLDASAYFADPDGDALAYAAESSDAAVVTVSVSGDEVTVRAAGQGEAVVTVTARDPHGGSAEQTFTVTVPNRAPVVVEPIPDLGTSPGGSRVVDLSGHLRDPDGDALDYAARSSNAGVAAVRLSGAILTVSGLADGTAVVTVTASDPLGASAGQDFMVTVLNRAPEPVGSIPDVEVLPGDTAGVDASEYFSDPDGDALAYATVTSGGGVATVRVSGGTVVVRGVARGGVEVTVTATDPHGLTAEQIFTVTVPNRAPEVAREMPAMEAFTGEPRGMDASGYFSDPDGDALTYAAESSDPVVVEVSVSRETVTVAPVGPGAAVVTVTASDPAGSSAGQSFAVTVPNRAPEVFQFILDETVSAGESYEVDLDHYFVDPDGDGLAYTAESEDTSVATVSVSGTTFGVSGVENGSVTVTVTASDFEDLTAEQQFTVTVAEPNRAPEPAGSIPNVELMPDSSARVNASRYFTDPDADPLVYTATSSNTARATVAVSGSTVTVTGQATGSAEITVTATDPDKLSATQEFTVAVRTAARSDLLVDSPEADPDEVAPGEEFTLSAVVRNQGGAAASSGTTLRYYRSTDADIDTRDTEIGTDQVPKLGAARNSGESLDVTAPSTTGTYYYGACADAVGNESDKGNNCSAAVKVTVTQSNRAPRAAGTIPDVDVLPDSSFTLDAAAYFTDPDSDPLVHTARSSNTARATVAVSGSTVTVTGQATGSAQITVTATDPDKLSATQRFTVTVRATARSDLVVEPPGADPDRVEPGEDFTLSGVVRNRGTAAASSGTTLRYYRSTDADIDTDDTQVDTDDIARLDRAKTSSKSLTVTSPSDEGTYYYGACADSVNNESDTGNNCSAGVRVRVTSNRAPETVGSLPYKWMTEDDEFSFDVSSYFTDPDDDELEYSARSSDKDVAAASVDGATLTVTGGVAYDGWKVALIYVTATDPEDLSATQRMIVDVVVGQPDLRSSSVYLYPSDTVVAGGRLDVTLTISNTGGADAPSTTGRFLYSRNYNIDTDDTELKAFDIPELEARDRVTIRLAATAPSETGRFYFGACSDAVEDEYISDNNCSAEGIIRRVVKGPNRAPELHRDLPAISVAVDDSTQINLNRHFRDRDGDTLTYRATSQDTEKVTVSVTDSVLTVKGVAKGEAAGSARGTDPGGLWDEGGFDVCVMPCKESRFYLVQAVQSFGTTSGSVPLLAGEKALLRVFVIASKAGDADIPKVEATFSSASGGWTRTATIEAGSEEIPLEIDESDLAKSANAEISASWIQPDVEVYITIDPDNTLPDSMGVTRRIPDEGTLSIDARTVPTLDLTLVPFLWTEDPDSAAIEWASKLADGSTDFAAAHYPYTLLPVEEVDGTEHDPVETDNDSIHVIYSSTIALRTAEGGTGHYMGLISPNVSGVAGRAWLGGKVSASITVGKIIGHELGHNFNLKHAPGCNATQEDPDNPRDDGIGAWGYDFRGDSLIPPATPDMMSYCYNVWLSDYQFEKALNHRTRADYRGGSSPDPTRSILVWGGIGPDGEPYLEPAIAIDAVPSLPTGPGPYRIVGRAEDGAELFSFRFDMPEVTDGDGGSAFAFAIPVQSAWAGNLADITLAAGALTSTLDRDTDRPLVFLRDPVTRQIRGIFRNVTDATMRRIEEAKRRGLEVLTSRGIPDLGK